MKKLTHVEARARWEQMREYYRDGHTQREVAEKFGTTRDYAKNICKGIRPGNQYTNGLFDREANAKKYVEKIGGYEYAGNFTGVDGFVDIRCKECGHIQRKSMVSIRHGNQPRCPVCIANAKEKKQADAVKAREEDRKRRKLERYLTYKFTQFEFKVCPVCNSLFVGGQKYCSTLCATRFNNTKNKDRRLRKMSAVKKDNGIRLEQLYRKSNGICAICGHICDMDDYTIKDGAFVAGNNYPSIDHIIPLSKGGEHSWSNIQLAHRACNIKKRDII